MVDIAGINISKHLAHYIPIIGEMKRQGEYERAETVLEALVDRVDRCSSKSWEQYAPFYYEQLAIVYRKNKVIEKEVKIIQRYLDRATVDFKGKFAERLMKALTILNKPKEVRAPAKIRDVAAQPVPDEQLSFFVQGSKPEPYRVVFTRIGNNVTGQCSCRASIFRQVCKHQLGLLQGDITNLVNGDADDIVRLHEIIRGSDVGNGYQQYIQAPSKERLATLKNAIKD